MNGGFAYAPFDNPGNRDGFLMRHEKLAEKRTIIFSIDKINLELKEGRRPMTRARMRKKKKCIKKELNKGPISNRKIEHRRKEDSDKQ